MIWTVVGTIAIVAAVIGTGVVVDRKWGILPRPRELEAAGKPKPLPPHAPGAAAETALRVTATDRARLLVTQRCPACKATMTAGPDDRATYDGRELLLTRFTCPRCATTRTLYVALGD